MSIRTALSSDLDRISELGSQSLKDGPYKGIIEDRPEHARNFAGFILENGKILVAEEDGLVIGLIGFILANHHFSGQRYAAELMWYCLPDHRKGGAAMKLLWEAEKAAKDMGAKTMVFTAPNEDVSAIYQRFGYRKLEVAYSKVL